MRVRVCRRAFEKTTTTPTALSLSVALSSLEPSFWAASARFHLVFPRVRRQKVFESIMTKYIDICVELQMHRHAKDGLHQYRNIAQQQAPRVPPSLRTLSHTLSGAHGRGAHVAVVSSHRFFGAARAQTFARGGHQVPHRGGRGARRQGGGRRQESQLASRAASRNKSVLTKRTTFLLLERANSKNNARMMTLWGICLGR